jgi:phage major head subunit gpT-like protein
MIEAAAAKGPIIMEAVGVDWITAADAGDAKPKRFSMTAYTGGPMQVNSYGPPVIIDLSGIKARAPLPILRDHDPSRVIGHADEVNVTESAIKLAGVISGAGPDATEVQASASNGFPWKASVGARPDKLEFISDGVATKVNGKTFTGPLYVARKSTLGETSFVALGADRKATAKVAATAAQYREIDMNFEKWIEAMGLSLEELREDQTQKLRAKYDAEVKAAEIKANEANSLPVVDAPTFDLQAIGLAYAQHEAVIEATAEEYRDKVSAADSAKLFLVARKAAIEAKAAALKEQWAAPRLEAEYIKAAALFRADLMVAERPKGPAVHSSSRDFSAPAIEAALCRTVGVTNLEKHFTPEVLEASESHRNLGLQEVILLCASANGYTGRTRINDANLREVIKAAFSTHTITTLLTSTGNKALLEGFNAIPATWREVAAVRSVTDFKELTAYRLTADLEYEEVGPSGEIKHGTAAQESYTRQVVTYGKMLAITRQDIINDDLGAFDAVRQRLGLGAAIKLNKVFWTLWLTTVNGAVFWTSARGNYQSGAATVLAEAGLNTALKLFRDLKGPDGNRVGLNPTKLLVPSDLEATAAKYYKSSEMRDTTASTKIPTTNIYFNRFAPVVVPELSDSDFTGYSATHWWLLPDPGMLASMEMCFLNGQQTPTIESAEADFDTLGIQFRGYHDFGPNVSEWRASVMSAGA